MTGPNAVEREFWLYGKWSQAGVPHKGWACVDIEDLGEPSATCEMCEIVQIQFVHHMRHPDYPETLRCGCVCAGRMEEDYGGAQRRETAFQYVCAQRLKWMTRTWWRAPGPDDWDTRYLNVDGYNVVVRPVGKKWGWWVFNRSDIDKQAFSPPLFDTMDAAKRHTFAVLTQMKSEEAREHGRESGEGS